MVVKAAEADAEAKFLAGTGIARQRQAIINGLRESVMHFQQDIGDVNSKDVMEMMMMTQYFDTMKDMGTHGNNSTIFVPGAGRRRRRRLVHPHGHHAGERRDETLNPKASV